MNEDDHKEKELSAHEAALELEELCRVYDVELSDDIVPYDCYRFGADSKRAKVLIDILIEHYIDNLE